MIVQIPRISRLAPASCDHQLQPLREVGTMEKTQFWDIEDVMEALRLANRCGIAPETLRPVPAGGRLGR